MLKKDFIIKNKWLIGAFIAFGLIAVINNFHFSPAKEAVAAGPQDSVDTMIPKGYVLVPLDLENIEQLSSLIGNSGVVDLYTGGTDIKKRQLVASRVKIIQAPYNPQVYAALLSEAEGSVIQNYLGPFRAVVQNPKQVGSQVTKGSRQNLSIVYQR